MTFQEQIIEAAIINAHPSLKGTDIIPVLNATGNLTVAAAVILGMWQHPANPKALPSNYISKDSHIGFEVKSYDMWKEQWTVEIESMKSEMIWVPTEPTEVPVPTLEHIWGNLELKFMSDYGNIGKHQAAKYYKVSMEEVRRETHYSNTQSVKREVCISHYDFK